MSDFEQEPEEYDVQDEVKELLARGREQGFLTYEEIHEALPEHALEGDKYDEMIALIVEMGIDVVESAQEDDGVIATDDEEEVPSAAALKRKPKSAVPPIRYACTCAKWAQLTSSPAKAKSPSPSASKQG